MREVMLDCVGMVFEWNVTTPIYRVMDRSQLKSVNHGIVSSSPLSGFDLQSR